MAASSSLQAKMLKDFLIDDGHSCSSSKSFQYHQRKTSKSVVQQLPQIILKGSKSNKTSKMFAIHKASEIVTNALKFFPFASIKSPSILPRSISRRLSVRKRDRYDYFEKEAANKVKVKDILRWRSFRDLAQERSTPLDLVPCSPDRCTSMDSLCSTLTSSKNSSWCDSDFTADDFPSWCYETDECFHENRMKMEKIRTMDMDSPKRNLPIDYEYEQHTPISVLDSPFQKDEESILKFHRSLSNIDRRKCMLMQRIKEFECLADVEPINLEHQFSTQKSNFIGGQKGDEDVNEDEEKATQLLGHLIDKILANNCDPCLESQLLFDFFKHELTTSGKHKDDKYEKEIARLGETWLSGEYEGLFEWEVEGKRENYVREMERGVRWNKLEEDQEEIGLQLESLLIGSFVDELLIDLIAP